MAASRQSQNGGLCIVLSCADIPAYTDSLASLAAPERRNYFRISAPHLAAGMRFCNSKELSPQRRASHSGGSEGDRWDFGGAWRAVRWQNRAPAGGLANGRREERAMSIEEGKGK
jgi:hypothetical protein